MFLGCSSSVVGIGSLTDLLIGVSIPSLCSFISKVLKTSRNTKKRGGVISTPLLLNTTTWCAQAMPKAGCYETTNNNVSQSLHTYKVQSTRPSTVSASQTFRQQWSRTSSLKKSKGKHQYHLPLRIAGYCEQKTQGIWTESYKSVQDMFQVWPKHRKVSSIRNQAGDSLYLTCYAIGLNSESMPSLNTWENETKRNTQNWTETKIKLLTEYLL